MNIPSHLAPYARTIALPDGTRLHCYIAGNPSASPLLLLHGLGDEADTWRYLIAPLAERYWVIAPDLPGFARSDKPRVDYTPVFFTRSVLALMDVLLIERAHCVGHSLGALIAQRLILARPQRVLSLTLIAGGLPIARRRPPPALFAFLTPGLGEAAYFSLRRSQDAAYETLRPYYYDVDALPETERVFLRERVWERIFNPGQQRAFLSTLRWLAVEQASRAEEHAQRLATATTPTSLIWGENDQIQPVAVAKALVAHLPLSQLRTIAECGHNPQHERPAELFHLLINER
jgi:pimeloyl-ACP methyl ester carboxylesterase